MKALVSICNFSYSKLLRLWYSAIRKMSDIQIYVILLNEFVPENISGINFISANPGGNPFSPELPDHACAEKLRFFRHLPQEINSVFFLDIDVLALQNFWDNTEYFEASKRYLVMCPDQFVGYKEKMEEEFRLFDPAFRMKFNLDGSYFYFNTGVFFANRKLHEKLFSQILDVWQKYVSSQGRMPSIFDQNIINYCLIKYGVNVLAMPIQNNCLRQYGAVIQNGKLILNGKSVKTYHFNGGDGEIKYSRWMDLLDRLEVQNENLEP